MRYFMISVLLHSYLLNIKIFYRYCRNFFTEQLDFFIIIADNITNIFWRFLIMLKSITVGNFRAFSEKVTLDFSEVGKYDFNTEAIKNGLVKTAIMYGKNAGGKSSIAYAIFDIVSNLTDKFMGISHDENYKNAFNMKQPVTFEYNFKFRDKEVKYIYEKSDFETFSSESLSIDGKIVINYYKDDLNTAFEVYLKGTENLQKDLKESKISAVKWVNSNSALENTEENKIFKEFINFVNRMLLFWSLESRSFVGYATGRQILINEIIKLGHFEDFKSFFKEAGIEDEFECKSINGEMQLLVKYGDKTLQFETVNSSGMSSLLLVYFWLQDLLNNTNNDKSPSFICIDEFDAFYHFELSRFIIEKLKKCNCQVLLTTHNTALLTNDILRPDCYYICSKKEIVNANKSTYKELRQGHNLEKMYRGGTFGL